MFLVSVLFALSISVWLERGEARAQAPAVSGSEAATAEDLLQKAERSLQREDYETAATALEAHLAQDSADFRARFNLAYAYSMTNRAARAVEQYKQVVAEQPDLLPAHLNLGMLLRQEGKNEEALAHLERVTAAQPEHWTALAEMGHALGNLHRVAEARSAYEAALKLRPENHSTRMDLAALLAASDPAAAESQLRVVLREMPTEQEARLHLARLLEARSAPATPARDEALQLYEELLQTPPARKEIQLHLADLYLAEKRPAEAIAHLEAARADGAVPAEANQLLLEAYLASNQKGRAQQLLPEMIAQQPGNARLHLALGSLRNEMRQYAEAAQSFARAAELDPKNEMAWTNLASALYLLKDYARTAAALQRVAALGADTAGTYFLRAITLDKLGAQAEALENYQKFLSLDGGQNPDQQFQARERSRILTEELKRKGRR